MPMPDISDLVDEAAEQIRATAEADGLTAGTAIDVVQAMYAVRTRKGAGDVNLVGNRRRLAHVAGSAMHDARLDPDQLRRAVIAKLTPNHTAST
ncbi:hypothetical protein [Amycolatopsis sp. cg9]|uniref:hypothetical protein n=1 Tax=Amycolatopsis sp. cg9 TaxID=3238801 RepID=UPI003524E46B